MLSTSEPFHDKLHLPLSFLTEPSFVHADVIREGRYKEVGEDDKIYFFFTEVSVEYEFFGKLLIPRVARVCKVSSRHVPSVWSNCTFVSSERQYVSAELFISNLRGGLFLSVTVFPLYIAIFYGKYSF